MNRLMIGAIAMMLFGCGKDSPDHAAKAKSLADQACACKGDEKCLEKAEQAWEAWQTQARKGKKPDDATMAKIEAEEERAEACASTDSAGPDEEAPKTDPGTPPAGEVSAEAKAALAELTAAKDAICACADKDCAVAALPKFEEVDAKLKALFPDPSNVPKDVTEPREGIMLGFAACAAKYNQ